MSIKNAFKKLKEGIEDLSELEVQTYTGTVSATINEQAKDNIIDWVQLFKDAEAEGKVVLAAATKIKADGDTYNFITDAEVPTSVLEAHQTAVEAGNQVRENIIDLFSDLIGIDTDDA